MLKMKALTLSLFSLITVLSFILAPGTTEGLTNGIGSNLGTNNEGKGGIAQILVNLQKLMDVFQPPERVNFFLYTQKNPLKPQELRIGDTGSVTKSNFNASHPTRFTIHGWMSSSELEVNTLIRDAYLSKGPHNIIAVNWISKSLNLNYADSVKHVPRVGQKVGAFIDFMAENNWLKPENLTIAGHSLGSHVAGSAGRSLKTGKLHSIIGLDPASAGFNYDTSIHRLRTSDAHYVESIQTDCSRSGYYRPIGNASFYANGGMYQPGCGLDITGICAHIRAYKYLAEAIKADGFPSIKCNSYQDALNQRCGNEISKTVRMGAPNNADVASGIFFVPVLPYPPYMYK